MDIQTIHIVTEVDMEFTEMESVILAEAAVRASLHPDREYPLKQFYNGLTLTFDELRRLTEGIETCINKDVFREELLHVSAYGNDAEELTARAEELREELEELLDGGRSGWHEATHER